MCMLLQKIALNINKTIFEIAFINEYIENTVHSCVLKAEKSAHISVIKTVVRRKKLHGKFYILTYKPKCM